MYRRPVRPYPGEGWVMPTGGPDPDRDVAKSPHWTAAHDTRRIAPVVETAPTRTQSLSAKEKAELWRAADTLRGHMNAAEYKHVVLGLIFLKYLSDAFDEHHAELLKLVDEGADPEDPDEYRAEGLYGVPTDARWAGQKDKATSPAIGQLVDDEILALAHANAILAGGGT